MYHLSVQPGLGKSYISYNYGGGGLKIMVTMKFFEYRWNKYYRSVVEFHYKFCDFIEKDVYVGTVIGANGLKCPVKPGKHTVMNVTAHFDDFPSPLPFEKARVNFIFNTSNGDLVAEGAVYFSVKNNDVKNKKAKRI
ncbi:PREDICTED: uncharacterized protein LOC106128308 isoform X2 [Papilio xuthus]|uniref:Uncharacterized protein LOC106128308 isoform X2 n=1 Tax=Papilio xuthus TaxID=66420 RepID=A0AAJ6ZYM4_PAPXU|nr:PREDICTED: uncharacterized protein LOC106128308 isoform X2 [Papilio xuthus]